MPDAIGLPAFAMEYAAKRLCRHCDRPLAAATVTAAGVRLYRNCPGFIGFFFDALCVCGGRIHTVLESSNVNRHTLGVLLGDWQWRETVVLKDSPPAEPELLTQREPMPGMTLVTRGLSVKHIHGGYTSAGSVEPPRNYLMCRWNSAATQRPIDGVIRIESRSRFRIAQLPPEEKVKPPEWDNVLSLPDGAVFEIDGRTFRKLGRAEIEALVRDKLFIYAALFPHRKKAREH